MKQTKIVFTGAGGGGAHNLISTIRRRGAYLIIGLDRDPLKAARSNVDRRYVVPSADSSDYLIRLNQILESESPALIIPTNDAEVAVLSRMRSEIKAPLFFPDRETVETCLNKWTFHEFALANNVRTAKTFRVTDLDDIEEIFAQFDDSPLWCRIIFGAGSKGATKVRDPEQARWWIKYWHEMRNVPISHFTISDFLPGRDFACQSTWHSGRLVLMKAAERLSYIEAASRPSNMSSSPEIARTVNDPQLFEFCIDLIRKLSPGGPHGNYGIDIKLNSKDEFCVTEVNIGRFFMIANLFNLSGEHSMIDTYLELALGESVSLADPFDYSDKYLVRSLDTLPSVFDAHELETRLENSQAKAA